MNKSRFALLGGVLGLYFTATGGCRALLRGDGSLPAVLAGPFISGHALDLIVAALSIVVIAAALLTEEWGTSLRRVALLRGVALGCAILTAMGVAAIVHSASTASTPLLGVVSAVTVAQAAVCVLASGTLLVHAETRRFAYTPLAVTTLTAALVAAVFLVPKS